MNGSQIRTVTRAGKTYEQSVGNIGRTSSREYKPHRLCQLFPPMSDAEYAGLKESIRVDGLFNPITLYQEEILDGKERYRACLEVGVVPTFKEWTPQSDKDTPEAFVNSMNLMRQHLSQDERTAELKRCEDIIEVGIGKMLDALSFSKQYREGEGYAETAADYRMTPKEADEFVKSQSERLKKS